MFITTIDAIRRMSTCRVSLDISPPPQRPCSPSRGGFRQQTRSRPLIVKKTDSWLAGGRDVHHDKARTQRCQTAKAAKPGWMDGLAPRPKSAAAARAQKRTKAPNIITPSSMFCDSLKGRGVVEFCPDAPYQYAVDYRNTGFTPSYAPIRSRHAQFAPHVGVLCEHCGGERQHEQEQKEQEQQEQQQEEDYEEDTDVILDMVAQNNKYNQRREADYQNNREYDDNNDTNGDNYNTANNDNHNNATNYDDKNTARTPWSTPREVVVSIAIGDRNVAEFETTSPLPSTDRQRDQTVTKDALKRVLLEG